ncbi:MAG: hypothetical protein WC683_09985 [bacterium]
MDRKWQCKLCNGSEEINFDLGSEQCSCVEALAEGERRGMEKALAMWDGPEVPVNKFGAALRAAIEGEK